MIDNESMGTGSGLALVDALNLKSNTAEAGLAPRPRCATSAPLVIPVSSRRAAPLEASFPRPLHAEQSTCPLRSPDDGSVRKLPRVVVYPRHKGYSGHYTFY